MTGRAHADDVANMLSRGGRMPAWVARLFARYRQMSGCYDAHTAACFEHAWRRSESLPSLVEWTRFRRELGSAADPVLANALRQQLGDRQDATAVRALELLHEVSATGDMDGQDAVDWLAPHAEHSPPIADMLERNGASLAPRARQLARIHAAQSDWRSAFAADLLGAGRVCVVGNAGSLNGARLGHVIDQQPRVVRFNRWTGPASAPDLGSRRDVWVCAPRFLAQLDGLPRDLPPWVILTGPDARYARAGRPVGWDLVLGMLEAGVKVLTFPLAAWGETVVSLGAPPSAGVLFLAWAHRLLGDFEHLVIAGFDIASAGTKGYHHAGPAIRGGRRHAWEREKALLDEWRNQGLRSLPETDQVF